MTDNPCPFCNGPRNKIARSIINRIGHEPSFAELWARLDRAEADRDRMLSALQIALDAAARNGGAIKPRERNILYRAMRKVSSCHASQEPTT